MAPSLAAGDLVAERFVIEKLPGFGSGESAERFIRESRLLATLDHAGIVRHVADGVLPDGRAYLAMEWLEGESLASRIEKGLGVEETITLAVQVADALAAAHRRGVVH